MNRGQEIVFFDVLDVFYMYSYFQFGKKSFDVQYVTKMAVGLQGRLYMENQRKHVHVYTKLELSPLIAMDIEMGVYHIHAG